MPADAHHSSREAWLLTAIEQTEQFIATEAVEARTELAFSAPGERDHDEATDALVQLDRARTTLIALGNELDLIRDRRALRDATSASEASAD